MPLSEVQANSMTKDDAEIKHKPPSYDFCEEKLEEMQQTLEKCSGDHFWTSSEDKSLLYFLSYCENNFVLLQGRFFTHRTIGSLKTRLRKLHKKNEIVLDTPVKKRLSIGRKLGDGLANLGNYGMKAAKLLTPSNLNKSAEVQDEEIETESDLKELLEDEETETEKTNNDLEPQEEKAEAEPVDFTLEVFFFIYLPILIFSAAFIAIHVLTDEQITNHFGCIWIVEFKTSMRANTNRWLEGIRSLFQ